METKTQVVSASRSHVGMVRPHNEDRVFAGNSVWVVADGMGGQAAGEVASALVVQEFQNAERRGIPDASFLRAIIARTNSQILAYGRTHDEAIGLGSTVAGVVQTTLGGLNHWLVFNIGDSRVYRWEQGRLTQLTQDHSEVAELVARGRITADQARTHAQRNVLTRCLGSYPSPMVDIHILPANGAEAFLVCSDGLTSELTDMEIAEILANTTHPHQATTQLVDEALNHGGRDNVSAVVVSSGAPSLASPPVAVYNVEEDTIPQHTPREGNQWQMSSRMVSEPAR